MQWNREAGVLVVNNPRTGAAAVQRLRGCVPVPGISPWATPREIRRSPEMKELWPTMTKIITVRAVEPRFLSACELAGLSPEEAVARLEKAEVKNWPRVFQPQGRWLASKYDVVLVTRKIAEYANKGQFGRGASRTNQTGAGTRNIDNALLPRVLALYADDLAIFSKLQVWTPDDKIMLMAGECVPCRIKREEALARANAALPKDS